MGNDIEIFCEKMKKMRPCIDYDIDGIVFKVNDFFLQNMLGSVGRSPKWSIAYKFPAKIADSRIKNIVIQIGRTGVLTPVAQIEPVILDRVLISRITLHNFYEIQRLDIRVGDFVRIKRSGDVIPNIVK